MTPRSAIELTGTWADNFGGMTDITFTRWGDYILSDYDNEANWAVTQNAPDADFFSSTTTSSGHSRMSTTIGGFAQWRSESKPWKPHV